MPAEDDDDQDQTDLVPRSHIRGLEEKAKKADELERQLNSVLRDNAFAKALGTSTAEPWFQYFEKGYDGELTADAIREAAANAGFGTRTESPEQPVATPQTPTPPDLAAHQRMAAAAVGAAPPPPFDLAEAINQAQSPEEVMALVEAHGEKHGIISSRLAQ